jgi:hypothetical protein
MNNREKSQVTIFTIMIVVLILLLFCPVVFGQVSAFPFGTVSGTVFNSNGKTPLALNNFAANNFYFVKNTDTGNVVWNGTTDSNGYYILNESTGHYEVEAVYNNKIVGQSPTFYLNNANHVIENLTTNSTPTDLITICSSNL